MSKVYLNIGEKYNSLIKWFLSLFIPFILYGLYKNGYSLYKNNFVSALSLFKPVLFLLISIIIPIIFCKVRKKDFLSYELLLSILFFMIAPYNTNIFIYFGIVFIINFLYKYANINLLVMGMLLNLLILFIMHKYSFLNPLESSSAHNYAFFDYLIGRGYGGIANSLLIMSVISIIVLCTLLIYKRQIPIMTFSVFYTLIIITSLVKGDFALDILFNNNMIFAIIFIAPLSKYSPYTRGGCYVFGIILGLLCFIASFVSLDIGVYVSILLLSFIYPLIDKCIIKLGH